MVSSTGGAHHHRSTTKTTHKAFKSRHSTKSSLKTKNKGKVDDTGAVSRRNHHQQLMSKLERRNKARQLAANKHKDLVREFKIFDGRRGAPRIVAVVPLCADVSAANVIPQLLRGLEMDVTVPEAGLATTGIERFKQKIQWVVLPRKMMAVLDGCKAADFVVFVLSAKQEVDKFGEGVLRSILAQGVSNTFTVVEHLDTVEQAKYRPDVKNSLLSYIRHFFATTERVYDVQNPQDSLNLIRSLCTGHPKGVSWRDARSYLLADDVRWDEEADTLVVDGIVRGKGLKADRLVYIQGHGDFQIEKICALPDTTLSSRDAADEDAMAVDSVPTPTLETLDVPTESQDDLQDLGPENAAGADGDIEIPDTVSEAPSGVSTTSSRRGVLLDDHHYFNDDLDTPNTPYELPRKVPKGTSSYQAAWYLDDEDYGSDTTQDDELSQPTDISMTEPGAQPEDGVEGLAGPAATEGAPTEFGDDAKSEHFLDPSPDQEAAAIQAFRDRHKELAEEREFPDEIELHPQVLARERLLRYRALKSLRTSVWDTTEDSPHEPEDWRRLARINNYARTKTQVTREALVGGVAAGSRVRVFLRDVPREVVEARTENPGHPFVLFSLLRHEHKQSVLNVSLTPSADYAGDPIKAKDELILQLGPRRLHINPLFSQAGGTGSNGVAKFERFLVPGRTTVASFVGPITFGSVPATYWKRSDRGEESAESGEESWELVGQGTMLGSDCSRVVAKRIVLTGHPYKIHRKLVTVRYMFFNREDVEWFKAVPLYTKRGRSGYIKEALGTHGYYKATFDGRINPQDAVAMSLYKRVFPRGSTEFQE